jgi:hypothetical protein
MEDIPVFKLNHSFSAAERARGGDVNQKGNEIDKRAG